MSEFSVDGKVLGEVLKGFSGIGKDSRLPILKTLKADFSGGLLTLEGTDLESCLTARISGHGDDTGPFLIPEKELKSMVRKGSMVFKVEGKRVSVKVESVEREFSPMPVEDFPQISREMGEKIGGFVFALGELQARLPDLFLPGEYSTDFVQFWSEPTLGKVGFAGTCGYRLYVWELPAGSSEILGRKFETGFSHQGLLRAFIKVKGQATVEFFQKHLEGENQGVFPVRVTIEGQDYEIVWESMNQQLSRFPNWRNLVYQDLPENILVFSREKLVDLCSNLIRGRRVDFGGVLRRVGGEFEISLLDKETPAKGRILPEKVEGEFFPESGGKIGVNLAYLAQAAGRVNGDSVCLKFWGDPMKHFWGGNESEGVWGYIMPMRVE